MRRVGASDALSDSVDKIALMNRRLERRGGAAGGAEGGGDAEGYHDLGQGDDSCAPWLQLARSHCSCAARQLTKRCIFEFDAAQV